MVNTKTTETGTPAKSTVDVIDEVFRQLSPKTGAKTKLKATASTASTKAATKRKIITRSKKQKEKNRNDEGIDEMDATEVEATNVPPPEDDDIVFGSIDSDGNEVEIQENSIENEEKVDFLPPNTTNVIALQAAHVWCGD